MSNISKIQRSKIATFIDTTPGSTATYKILGVRNYRICNKLQPSNFYRTLDNTRQCNNYT